METQTYELSGKVMPFLVPLDESGAWLNGDEAQQDEDSSRRAHRAPRVFRRAKVDQATVARLIEGVKLL